MSTLPQDTSPKRLSFYGALTEKFGEELDAYVNTPREAIQLVHANDSALAREYLLTGRYAMIKNGTELVTSKNIDEPLLESDELSFIPNVAGKDFGLILGIIAVVLAVVAIGLAFMGLPEDELGGSSGGIQRGVNTANEGDMVPIVYGRVRTTPKVISSQRIAEHPERSSKQVLPNTVTSTLVFALSEGQIGGLGSSSSDREKNIILNGTQLRSDSGSVNYDDVIHEFRDGSDPQTKLGLMQGSASPRNPAVNQALKYNEPVTVTLSSGIDSARVQLRCQSMFKTKKGKLKPTEVVFRIETKLTSGSSWTTRRTLNLYGKYTATQLFQIQVPLDDSNQYDVRVTRLTVDAQDENTNDSFTFENVEEINNDQVSYDGTAVLALQYDQTSFNGRNPEVEVVQDGKIVRVPSNFNPVTRTYTGIWNGSFTNAWSDSVAWCTADLIDNNRYGVGIKLKDRYNKFNLYELDQYAVAPVDDGFGGTEPRFTMNVEIDSRDKAIEALKKVGSIFRAAPYWFASELNFSMDKAENVTRVITQAKVKDGEFSYAGAGTDARPNHVSITYQNKLDRYRKSQVSYRDHDSVSKLGLIDQQRDGLTTSAGQALRAAKLLTITGGEVVTFTGVENSAGYKIGERAVLFDPVRMGKQHSGLVSSATTTTVTLDRSFEVEASKTYQIRCVLADGSTEERTVTNAVGSHTTLSVSGSFSSAPVSQSEWGVTASDLSPVSFVIQSVADKGKGEYDISGIRYDANKYSEIDGVNSVDTPNYVFVPDPGFVGIPQNLNVTLDKYADPGGYRQDAIFTWSAPIDRDDILSYDVEYEFENAPAVRTLGVTDLTHRFPNIEEGEYVFRVRANTLDVSGAFASVAYTVEDVAPAELPSVSGLEIFNQGGSTEFANRDAKFVWRTQSAYQPFEELGQERFGAGSGYSDPQFKDFLIRIYNNDLTTIYREEEGILQPEYTYSYEKNLEDGGPNRSFVIGVSYRDRYGNTSDEAYLSVSNPQIGAASNISVTALLDSYKVSFDAPAGTDFAGVEVHHSATPGFTPSAATLVAEDNSTDIIVPLTGGSTRYVRTGMFDTFGKDNITYSAEQEITPESIEEISLSLSSSFTPNSPSTDFLSWTAGSISAAGRTVDQTNSVAADSVEYIAAPVYVYWTLGEDNLKTTTTFATAVASGNALIASYNGGVALELFAGAVNIKPTFSVDGLEFRANNPSANDLSWTAHSAVVTESDSSSSYAVSSGSASYTSGTMYVYYVKGSSSLSTTTDLATATGIDREIFAIYTGGQNVTANFGTVYDSTDMSLTVKFTPVPGTNTLNWSAGNALYTYNDIASTQAMSSGSVVYSGSTQYVYYVFGASALSTTTVLSNTFGRDRRLVATYNGGSLLAVSYGQFAYDGADVLVGTIATIQLADLSVDVDKIADDAVTSVKIVDGSIDTAKLADASVSLTKFANDLTPIEIVNSLPTTGNYEGRTVFLTTDGKLYRYASGAFTKAVPTTDLTGEIATGQIADDAVTVDKIVDDAITAAKLADDAVTSAKIADGSIDTDKLANDSVSLAKFANGITPVEIVSTLPTTGNYTGRTVFLTTDGKLYRYASGAFTKAVPTTDLTGQISTGQIANDAVTVAKIVDDAITAAKISDDAVTSDKIVDGAIDTDKLANDSVSLAKFASDLTPIEIVNSLPATGNYTGRTVFLTTDGKLYRYASGAFTKAVPTTDLTGQISTAQIANDAVTVNKIVDDAITAAKIANNAVTSDKIVDDAVTSGKIVDDAVTSGKIVDNAVTTGKIDANAVTANEIAANAVTAVKITAGAVNADKIATNAVTAVKINAGAVNADKIATNAVTASKINAGAVVADKIATNAVTAVKISANAVTASKIQAGAVETDKLAANAVTAGKIAANTITAGEIAANTITASELAANSVTASEINVANLAAVSTTTGTLTVNSAGFIRGGQTAYNTGSGFFLGYDSTAYKFSLGNPTGNSITWDGSTLNIDGVLAANTVTSSSIASNAVTAVKISANAVTASKIQAGAVETDKLAANAVTAGKIAANTITAGQIASNTITASELAANSVTASEINVANLAAVSTTTGTLTVNSAGFIRGGQTAYNTGSGFFLGYDSTAYKFSLGSPTGNSITWDGSTLNIDGVLAADIVTSSSIDSGAVTADSIASNAVTAVKIVANAVTASKIQAGAVTTDKLAANAVTAVKIAANTITAGQIASNTITATELAANSVTASEINVANLASVSTTTGTLTVNSAGFIRGGQTAYNTGSGFFLGYDSTAYKFSLGNPSGNNLTWDGSTLNIDGVLAADVVTSSSIIANAVTANKIAANAVTAVKISANAVTAGKIQAGAVTTAKLDAEAVTAAKIAANTITATQIASNTITATELAANSVTASEINVSNLAAVNTSTGTLVVNSGGHIRSGQTAYDTGTGFYLGNDAGTPKFSIGNASGNKLTWDGSNLDITGNVTLTGSLADASSNTGALTVNGALTMNTSGHIKGGQTAYDTGNGFFLGYSGGGYKASIGNNSGDKLTWDGSSLTVVGDLSVSGNLSSVSSTTGALNVNGALTVGSSGHVKGGQTAYNTGAGFFLGDDSGTYKFSLGDPSGNSLTWDGSTLNIDGVLAANSIQTDWIASGAISSRSITSSTGSIGATSNATDKIFLMLTAPYYNSTAGYSISFEASGIAIHSAGTGELRVRLGARTAGPSGTGPYGTINVFKSFAITSGNLVISLDHFAGLPTVGWYEVVLLFDFQNSGQTGVLNNGYVGVTELKR